MDAAESVGRLRNVPIEIVEAIVNNFSLGVRERGSGCYEARVNDNGLKSLGVFNSVDEAVEMSLLYELEFDDIMTLETLYKSNYRYFKNKDENDE